MSHIGVSVCFPYSGTVSLSVFSVNHTTVLCYTKGYDHYVMVQLNPLSSSLSPLVIKEKQLQIPRLRHCMTNRVSLTLHQVLILTCTYATARAKRNAITLT